VRQIALPLGGAGEAPGQTVAPGPWRPIHYLGSKLRILDPIVAALDLADPARGPVCDLFAGSGVVAGALARHRTVVANDVQEYSRVICSALLLPAGDAALPGPEAIGRARPALDAALAPLLEHEARCMAAAREGRVEPLCDLVEGGALVGFVSDTAPRDAALAAAMAETARRLAALPAEFDIPAGMVRRFGGLYFSYRQALELGLIAGAAHAMPAGAGRDRMLAALASAASEVANTVGRQFAQPIRPRDRHGRPKRHLVGKMLRDREADLPAACARALRRFAAVAPGGHPHRVLRLDYAEALASLPRGGVGAVYADPPYTRDHYSRFYHVLETLCRGDAPETSRTTRGPGLAISRGTYRRDRHQSPFCIKSQAPGAFERLFAGVRRLDAPLVLSYSPYALDSRARPRVMRVEDIETLARRHFAAVEVLPAGRIGHCKLNAAPLNAAASRDGELLLICRPA